MTAAAPQTTTETLRMYKVELKNSHENANLQKKRQYNRNCKQER